MPRLALAIIAALVLHVLLLMIVVPDPQVENPEIKGSGQVTVSIAHFSPEIEKPVDAIVEEQEIEEPVEHIEEKMQQIVEKIVPTQPIEPQEPEPVIFKEQPLKSIPVETQENLEQIDPVLEDNPDTVIEKKNDTKQRQREVLPVSSETESLQSPEPIVHRNKPPKYPSLARKRGWEGTVILEVDIRNDGMVKDIQVKQSSSYEMLDKEAQKTVRKWHFQPGSRAGKFVDMKVLVPVHFMLQEQ